MIDRSEQVLRHHYARSCMSCFNLEEQEGPIRFAVFFSVSAFWYGGFFCQIPLQLSSRVTAAVRKSYPIARLIWRSAKPAPTARA